MILLVAAHRFFAITYPVARTATYFIPFSVFAIVSILRDLKGRLRFARIPFEALAGVLLVQVVLQLNLSYYNHWPLRCGNPSDRAIHFGSAIQRAHKGHRRLDAGALPEFLS